MSDFGIVGSRLHLVNHSLKNYENALRYFKKKPIMITDEEKIVHYQNVESILQQVVDNLQNKLSKSILIDDNEIVNTLKRKHLKNWDDYKINLIQLHKKMCEHDSEIQKRDLSLLNDVADAMDISCSRLFKRMEKLQ